MTWLRDNNTQCGGRSAIKDDQPCSPGCLQHVTHPCEKCGRIMGRKPKPIERALIVRKPWIDLILSGDKCWEMRSKPTKIRGRIGLIEQGTGLIIGECDLDHSQILPLDKLELEAYRCFHQVDDLSLLDKWRFPWELKNVKRYEQPIPYQHPKGAVIWVNLTNGSQHEKGKQ